MKVEIDLDKQFCPKCMQYSFLTYKSDIVQHIREKYPYVLTLQDLYSKQLPEYEYETVLDYRFIVWCLRCNKAVLSISVDKEFFNQFGNQFSNQLDTKKLKRMIDI